MTTPSYTFNARFSQPGVVKPDGYLDPTGRTQRVFRHADHKFEWTTEEFTSWCKAMGKEWGYTVEVGCIGFPLEKDPWGRDEELGGASQVAAFRRVDDHSSGVSRKLRSRATYDAVGRDHHRLFIAHRFSAHPQAGSPRSVEEIRVALTRTFEEWGETVLRVEDLWFAKDIAMLCGGSTRVLIQVAEDDLQLSLQKVAGQPKGKWTVRFLGEVQCPGSQWHPAQNRVSQEIQMMVKENTETEEELDVLSCSSDSGICMSSDQANSWTYKEHDWWTQDEVVVDDWSCSWAK